MAVHDYDSNNFGNGEDKGYLWKQQFYSTTVFLSIEDLIECIQLPL